MGGDEDGVMIDLDAGAGKALVDELIAVCTEHGFSLWRTAGVSSKGGFWPGLAWNAAELVLQSAWSDLED